MPRDINELRRELARRLYALKAGYRQNGTFVPRDPYSTKPYVLFYTTKRVGGGVQDFDAIKPVKFAAS